MSIILTAHQARKMMPQLAQYEKSVETILTHVAQAAQQGKNFVPLTYGSEDYGIPDRKKWNSHGSSQIKLVIKELERLGYATVASNPSGTHLDLVW